MTDRGNILVIKLGALGDFIQALGPMQAIRRHHPQSRITLLTTKPFAALARECGAFDDVWIDTRPRWHSVGGWLALRARLNGGAFARVYDLQNNDRTGFYLRLFSPRPEWVGAAAGASHRNTDPARTGGTALAGHRQTLKLAGIDNVVPDDFSWVKTSPDDLLHGKGITPPYVLLVPGASPRHPEKRWPAARFGAVAAWLHGRGYRPVILGTEAEKPLAREIKTLCPEAADLTGQTSIPEIAVLARGAAAALANDTGPAHVISAAGCPVAVLFSRHSLPYRHAPEGNHVTVIREDILDTLAAERVQDALAAIFRPRKG